MILVDTSVIVPWLDKNHVAHKACTAAIEKWVQQDELAVSAVTFAELAAGARTREHVEEALKIFHRIDVDFDSAWRAGQAFRQYRRKDTDNPVLPDFLIRAQAATLDLPHLTNDRRRIKSFSEVNFEFAYVPSGRRLGRRETSCPGRDATTNVSPFPNGHQPKNARARSLQPQGFPSV